MSHHSSKSPHSPSPSNLSPSTTLRAPRPLSLATTSPSMIRVGRPALTPFHSFDTLASHYPLRFSHFVPDSAIYPPAPLSPPPAATYSRHATPPEPMRGAEHERGVKRSRSPEREEDEDERQGSDSGSEASENVEQPIMPAPKKRTRTLMTPDQLTALHRLLSQTRFPTTEQREQCGREIGLSARRVQVWFQNQRQKSKAQQQASATAGGSRQTAAPQISGPYRVFSYSSSYHEPHPRPYSSPHPYAYGEPLYHAPDTPPVLRRSQRLGSHHRGTSSSSYTAPPASSRYEYASGSRQPTAYAVAEQEFTHSPASYYERYQSPSRVRSPDPSGSTFRDDTLPPIWPENEQSLDTGVLAGVASTSATQARRPSLLPSGLPPPQPLEPTPIWNHPHTNPRYMRPLPHSSGLPALIGGSSRGRARSDPPTGSLLTASPMRRRSDRGLGLELYGIRPLADPGAREDAPSSPGRTRSDLVSLRVLHPLPLPAEPSGLGKPPESVSEPTRPRTSRGPSNSRRSSRDSQDKSRD